eukprot:GHVS01012442.1.p1 GENE.GHVS01012442.1~~GHVS01012442.1.p1  ORF type:complete len:412 (-),score=30.58 GHVS01012442.1:1670-2905(-)
MSIRRITVNFCFCWIIELLLLFNLVTCLRHECAFGPPPSAVFQGAYILLTLRARVVRPYGAQWACRWLSLCGFLARPLSGFQPFPSHGLSQRPTVPFSHTALSGPAIAMSSRMSNPTTVLHVRVATHNEMESAPIRSKIVRESNNSADPADNESDANSEVSAQKQAMTCEASTVEEIDLVRTCQYVDDGEEDRRPRAYVGKVCGDSSSDAERRTPENNPPWLSGLGLLVKADVWDFGLAMHRMELQRGGTLLLVEVMDQEQYFFRSRREEENEARKRDKEGATSERVDSEVAFVPEEVAAAQPISDQSLQKLSDSLLRVIERWDYLKELKILWKADVVVSSTGMIGDILYSQRCFISYKGFLVTVHLKEDYQGRMKVTFPLLERTDTNVVLNNKGRLILIRREIVKDVVLA